MSGTGTGSSLVRINSDLMDSSFDTVPEAKEFQLRINASDGTKEYGYTLKKGKRLPYPVSFDGFKFEFTRHLRPTVAGFIGEEVDAWWVFDKEGEDSEVHTTKLSSSFDDLYDDVPGNESLKATNSNLSSLEMSPSVSYSKRLKTLPPEVLHSRQNSPSSRIDLLESTMSPETPSAGPASSPSTRLASPSPSARKTAPSTPSCRPTQSLPKTPTTVHQNPDWLKTLLSNFDQEIISPCSSRTKAAVEANEYIQDERVNKTVKDEIVNMVMSKLRLIFGSSGKPGKKEMREIVIKMAFSYPTMFQQRLESEDLRAVDKIDIQASKMCDRYREKLRRDTARDARLGLGGEVGDEGAGGASGSGQSSAKGKTVKVYGLVTAKLNQTRKLVSDTAALLKSTNTEPDFLKREEVFKKLRPELTQLFRNTQNSIGGVCKGFFEDPLHLAKHFEYLSESPALDIMIRENLRKNLDKMEVYLKDCNKSVEFRQTMESFDLVTEIEFSGATTYKDIEILRLVCKHFDGSDGSEFIRFNVGSDSGYLFGDPPSECSSPHLVANLVDKSFVMEVWVEKSRLVGNMDLSTALGAFFHLCFVFNLKYPKGGEFVSDWLQRAVCMYGDTTGTRCWKRKDTVEKKLDSFYAKLGRLL